MKLVNLMAMKRQEQHCTSQSTNPVTHDKTLETSSCETGMLLTQPLLPWLCETRRVLNIWVEGDEV